MLVLALNCGSSSLKTALIDSADGRRLLDARVERIGENAELRVEENVSKARATNEAEALEVLLELVRRAARERPIEAVAHRIVHGGDRLVRPTLVDDSVLAELGAVSPLAPLHNPPALAALRSARAALPDLPHIAVFDTGFHSMLPPRAREYALPEDVRRRHGVRRYGFHGINHEHVMRTAAAHLRTEPQALRIVSCHLGAGGSVTAIEYGRSVETSMGMTPLEGLVMA
ncbi:MAG TPA: acetate kinase, partial [Steroidobacter sp.]|nr:acetate kinase [Steroidobacter sp.]